MSEVLSEEREKVDAYLQVIRERILAPIQKPEIQSSCTATLLLLFAAIDGLGKMYHPDKKADVTPRIKKFLDYMNGPYPARKKELLKLRHALVHNAINVESYLSHTETGRGQHLQKIGGSDFIYVNTRVVSEDFSVAFEQFSDEIHRDPALMKLAADRLVWKVDDASDADIPGDVSPSPPPAVEFIQTKN